MSLLITKFEVINTIFHVLEAWLEVSCHYRCTVLFTKEAYIHTHCVTMSICEKQLKFIRCCDKGFHKALYYLIYTQLLR
jgi:hypothetical protein